MSWKERSGYNRDRMKSRIITALRLVPAKGRSRGTGNAAPSHSSLRSLEHNFFQQVGHILSPVGRGLHRLVYFLPLDHVERRRLAVEQIGNGLAGDVVRFVFNPVQLDAMRLNAIHLRKRGDGLYDLVGALDDEPGQSHGRRSGLGDLVHDQSRRRPLNQVQHVVQGRR